MCRVRFIAGTAEFQFHLQHLRTSLLRQSAAAVEDMAQDEELSKKELASRTKRGQDSVKRSFTDLYRQMNIMQNFASSPTPKLNSTNPP